MTSMMSMSLHDVIALPTDGNPTQTSPQECGMGPIRPTRSAINVGGGEDRSDPLYSVGVAYDGQFRESPLPDSARANAVDPSDLQFKFTESSVISELAKMQETMTSTKVLLMHELAKVQETVFSTKGLLTESIWVHHNSKGAVDSGETRDHARHDIDVVEIQKSLKHIENLTTMRYAQQISSQAAQQAPSQVSQGDQIEKMLIVQADDILTRFESTLQIMIQPGGAIYRTLETLLANRTEPDTGTSVVKSVPKQSVPKQAFADIAGSKSSLDFSGSNKLNEGVASHETHPANRRATTVKDISENEESVPKHPQRAKCNRHIRKMKDGQRKALDSFAGVLLPRLFPGWLKDCCAQRQKRAREEDENVTDDKQLTCFDHFVHFVNGSYFNTFSFILILSNVGWMGYSTNHQMKNWKHKVDIETSFHDPWHEYVDICFAFLFGIEIGIRLLADGVLDFFLGEASRYNIFDLVVTGLAFFQILFETFNLGFMRVVRLLRVLRMLRAVRLLRAFADFRAILVMTLSSFPLLFWSGMLLIFWVFIMSMAIMEVLITNSDVHDEPTRIMVHKHYGSIPDTMYTLMQIATNGELWGLVANDAGKGGIGNTVRSLLFVYVFPLFFCMIPVIYGNFCLKVFDLQRLDTFLAMHRREDEETRFLQDLKDLLRILQVSLDEVLDNETALADMLEIRVPELQFFLETAGIAALPEELYSLISPIPDEEEAADPVTMRDFLYGCQWLKAGGLNVETIFLSEQLADLQHEQTLGSKMLKQMLRSKVFQNHKSLSFSTRA